MVELARSIKKGNLRMALYLVLFCFSVIALAPRTGQAVVVPNSKDQSQMTRAKDLEKIRTLLEKKEVASRLESMGLATPEVEKRLARLSDQDLHKLALEFDKLNPGGQVDTFALTMTLLIVLVVIIIVAAAAASEETTPTPRKGVQPEYQRPAPEAGPHT